MKNNQLFEKKTKKVMVLGAGRSQLPIIDLLHKYGCFVIVVSSKGDYPGFNCADSSVYLDVREKEEILKVAKEENIEAVLTDQLDEGVLTAAYISEQMGLKGIGYSVAQSFTDKYIMRNIAAKSGVSVPNYVSVCKKSDIKNAVVDLNFPLMIKPADSSASRGIYKVGSLHELEGKFDETISWSHSGKAIIEEYIEGIEYVVDSYTHQYKTKNLIVGHRDYFNIPNTFIPSATIFTDAESANSKLEKNIKDVNLSLIEGMGLSFGITHAEFIYNEEQDKIYLVEIAARGGGVFISSDLIPMACGVNANELLVKDALNEEISLENTKLTKGASAYFCYLVPKGVIAKIKGINEVKKIPNVSKAFFDNIFVGMETVDITNKASRKGPILVKGETKEECYQTLNAIKEKLRIDIITDNGVEHIIWN